MSERRRLDIIETSLAGMIGSFEDLNGKIASLVETVAALERKVKTLSKPKTRAKKVKDE